MTKSAVSVPEKVKDLLADPKDRIKLDDYLTGLLKDAIQSLASDTFWASVPQPSAEAIEQRLRYYENITRNLLSATILLARWGLPDHTFLLEKIYSRLAEENKNTGGLVIWQSMRWYPLSLLCYGAGIGALSARNYHMLPPIFFTAISSQVRSTGIVPLVVQTSDELNQIVDGFKLLPAHARHHVPRNEYMFGMLRMPLDDLLYLGGGYERYFDEFEILSALVYADLTASDRGRVWAAPGRFGWKSRSSGGPYGAFVKDMESQGESSPLLKIGMFSGRFSRFQEVAKSYSQLLSQISWY